MIIWKISLRDLEGVIREITKSIEKGEVVVCPTDTIYGLIADATNKEAIKKVLGIKKRNNQKAIPIFVKDIRMAKSLAQIDKKQEEFLRRVWPGEVTVVLERKKSCQLPKSLFGKKKTIGLRIPKHKLISSLLKKLDHPLTGTSANISGKPGSVKIKEVLNQFNNQKLQPDLIIDAGDLESKESSTVVDLTGRKPKLLRSGQLSKEELFKVLN